MSVNYLKQIRTNFIFVFIKLFYKFRSFYKEPWINDVTQIWPKIIVSIFYTVLCVHLELTAHFWSKFITDYLRLTSPQLSGTTPDTKDLDPLAVLHLNNQLYIWNKVLSEYI